ncbi:MAG: outer membrane beta-barrel protein [Prevotella sp.]
MLYMFVCQTVTVCAQEVVLSGRVLDKVSKEPLYKATLQLLAQDSTFITGTLSHEDGSFRMNAPGNSSLILKITSLGFKAGSFALATRTADRNMGALELEEEAVELQGTTVSANVPKVVVSDDTLIYNADAYRVPEGSTMEALVERIPGAKIDDSGKITVNGKEVKKFLMDGREFMGGDTKTVMKNMPAEVVDRIKAYDEKSDLAQLTGIDDGEEQMVLDFTVKKSMRKGVMVNTDVGYGTHDRYGARTMASKFAGSMRFSFMGNANNTNDMGFGGRRGRSGGGRNGLNSSKQTGLNVNYEKGKTLKVDGSVMWRHGDSDSWSRSASENFVNTKGAFSNSVNQNYSRNDGWNGKLKIQWKPDTLTTLTFRPDFSYKYDDGRRYGQSATFNEDPYLTVKDPLAEESMALLHEQGLAVNGRYNKSLSYGSATSWGASFQLHRKLSQSGRNIALNANTSFSDNTNKSLSATKVNLFLVQDQYGNDSTYQTNRLNLTPSRNTGYGVGLTYTEPIMKATFLQMSYKFQYNHSKSDRSTFDFPDIDPEEFQDILNGYRQWNSLLGRLDNPFDYYIDDELSRYSEYRNYTHNIDLQLRVVRKMYNLNVGVMLRPQRSHFVQDYQGLSVDTVRNVTNIAPTMNFRYRFSKRTNLRMTYRGSTSQPNITQLLDIVDDSNPLNVSKGNPGLKPSFTNNLNLKYDTYLNNKHQTTISTGANYRNVRNSISNMVTYDETTGARTTQPQNINGDWNASARFMVNTSIDTLNVWNINAYSQVNYNHYVGYVTLDRTSSSQKNVTKTTAYDQRLSASYRDKWLSVELDGDVVYTHTRNMLQANNNLDTWRFSYGLDVNVNFPWSMSISTDLHEHSRRGYTDKTLNTDELIWNVQIAQGFLRGKPLKVMLQFYDILRQQSNFSRSINANRRSDTEYNAINSYAMLHVSYRLNLLGGKRGRRGGQREMKMDDAFDFD